MRGRKMRKRRASDGASERPGLPNIPSLAPSLAHGALDDGRTGERGGSAFGPSVAGGHAIRVESVSDCHEGRRRRVGRWTDGMGSRRFGHSMPKEEHGTRKEGRKDRNKGGRRKVFSSSMWFRCDVAEPDPLSSPSRTIRLDVCTAPTEKEREQRTTKKEGGPEFCNWVGDGVQK